jgi:MFS family permease
MWAWIGVFLQASLAMTMSPASAGLAAKLAAFATIASGALGSVAAGVLADRLGRTTLTIAAMAVSGTCAATIGLLFGGQASVLVAVCIIWGISIVADSAQFSASIAELADRARVGTMLTLQTALGFTLTLVTIHLMPYFVAALTWRYAFVPLAIGPAVGVAAMFRLRQRPEARRLANGRR